MNHPLTKSASQRSEDLAGERRPRSGQLGGDAGLLPRQEIRKLVHRDVLRATEDFEESQFQPASLDLRLGSKAYRVEASFLPGSRKTVEEKLRELPHEVIDLDEGATLEKRSVYVVELLEYLELPETIAALANPKSSTGRLDIFTRLIADGSETFDNVSGGYRGRLYAEVSPRSFRVRMRRGSRLNQIRFRRRNSQHDKHEYRSLSDRELRELHDRTTLVDGDHFSVRHGLVLRVALDGIGPDRLVGYRARRHTSVLDVDRVGAYQVEDFWELIRARSNRRLTLDPDEFYILASKEKLHIPPAFAAEMVPIAPEMGEFRVHYAGFFDPGFGYTAEGHPGSRAVLEVRSHEVPFILEDGQTVGRLAFERMAEKPDSLYGQSGTSNYQGQELKLSKHFV